MPASTILEIIRQLLRGLAAYFEAKATREQIELQRLAITETERIEDEAKDLEHKITELRAAHTPDCDRIADELRVRAGRRATLLASIASGLPIPPKGPSGPDQVRTIQPGE